MEPTQTHTPNCQKVPFPYGEGVAAKHLRHAWSSLASQCDVHPNDSLFLHLARLADAPNSPMRRCQHLCLTTTGLEFSTAFQDRESLGSQQQQLRRVHQPVELPQPPF
jgi:hypothetical protein